VRSKMVHERKRVSIWLLQILKTKWL